MVVVVVLAANRVAGAIQAQSGLSIQLVNDLMNQQKIHAEQVSLLNQAISDSQVARLHAMPDGWIDRTLSKLEAEMGIDRASAKTLWRQAAGVD